MQLVPGIELSKQILEGLSTQIQQNGIRPKLAILQIGDEEASNVYVRKKLEVSKHIGIDTTVIRFRSGEEQEVRDSIANLNQDVSVNGIIIQLPTPGAEIFSTLNLIAPLKDVDGLTSITLGENWYTMDFSKLGATPKAILFALQHIAEKQNSTLENFLLSKTVLIINHNILIGKPLAGVLTNHDATVIIANAHTQNLEQLFTQADIIVSATGQKIIGETNAHHLKQGVVIIDSGFAREDGKSLGDVDPIAVSEKASWLTPVPRGIGPLGVAMLMQNTYDAFVSQNSLRPSQ